MMTGFNSPDRDQCVVRRELTNSPLHALTLMNNVVFVESARFLAESMLASGVTPVEQIAEGFRRVTMRYPETSELDELVAAFFELEVGFQEDAVGADALLRTGEKPRDPAYDLAQLASMTLVASAILNLDEVIVRN